MQLHIFTRYFNIQKDFSCFVDWRRCPAFLHVHLLSTEGAINHSKPQKITKSFAHSCSQLLYPASLHVHLFSSPSSITWLQSSPQDNIARVINQTCKANFTFHRRPYPVAMLSTSWFMVPVLFWAQICHLLFNRPSPRSCPLSSVCVGSIDA